MKIALLIFLLHCTGQAAWTPFEDFESYQLGDVAGAKLDGTSVASSPNSESLWRSNDPAQYTVVAEMSGGSGKVLLCAGNSNMDVATLPAMPDIADGTTATLFFRVKVLTSTSSSGYNRRLGPSGAPKLPLTSSEPTTGLYLRDKQFQPQQGSETLDFAKEKGWWSFWIVVNHSSDTYSIHAQSEEGGPQVLLAGDKSLSSDLSDSTSPLTDFYLFYWAGAPFYLDDLYIDTTGTNLTKPDMPIGVGIITGSESPTVHSPGDDIRVSVRFTDTVTLSKAAGLKLQLDIAGTRVDALHTGKLTGEIFTFSAKAPSVTTSVVTVAQNSLQLLDGATLRGNDSRPLVITHAAYVLPNNQISVKGLSVYPPVTGLAPSPHYRFRIHQANSPKWEQPFAWFTKCIDAGLPSKAYYNIAIGGWSNTYCNFEMANNVPVEVEITRLDPKSGLPVNIQKATPHPRRKVRSWRVENGKAYVVFDKPVLFAVDIDGQMDEQVAPCPSNNWGDFPFTNEKALHAVMIFANPFILDKPVLHSPGVLAVEPGQVPPDDGSWTTLYFKPGVHQLFKGDFEMKDDFRVRSNKTYYIPGDAIVHGTMNNARDSSDAKNIRVFGHGTLSGERIPHAGETWGIADENRWPTSPLQIYDHAEGCKVEGITFADPAFHTCTLAGNNNLNPGKFNYVRWAKALGWRGNGDGIQSNRGTYVEDCFMRVQDDSSYVSGMGIRRNVYWNDCNGDSLRCSFMTSEDPTSVPGERMVVEDLDIIYSRSIFVGGESRAAISLADLATEANDGSHVIFRNINFEDPLPRRTLIGWRMNDLKGKISGVRFENIRAAAPEALGMRNTILGGSASQISGLIFDNVILAGQHFQNTDDFVHNEYVKDLVFKNTAPETMTFLNTSKAGKWYINGDWDRGIEPANNDIVNHTAVADILVIDAPSYVGTLNVCHANKATISIQSGGHLSVTDRIALGDSGNGIIELLHGVLTICNRSADALTVKNGSVYMESGTLVWAGDHITEFQSWFAAGKLTSNKGKSVTLNEQAILIGKGSGSGIYADYNHENSGNTRVWALHLNE